MKSLGTNPHQDLGLWACVAPTAVCGKGLICCSLQDDLAIPCFLKLSHCLLGAPAINSSWGKARDVFLPGRSPNLAVKHLTIKPGTPGQGHEQREGVCWLCIVSVGRKAQAVLRAPFFPLALNLFLKSFIKCNFLQSTPNTLSRVQSFSSHMQIFCPRGQLSRSVTPWCIWHIIGSGNPPSAPVQPLPHASSKQRISTRTQPPTSAQIGFTQQSLAFPVIKLLVWSQTNCPYGDLAHTWDPAC